ncbi:MAG: hypothetical protein JWR26_3890 [Pedosphaera sp.]|nr:hypothetical protein [Pedosphaera sp.]
MKTILRLLFLIVVIGLGVWAWTAFFPKPEIEVRKRLNQLAKLASYSKGEGNIAMTVRIERLCALFADQVEVRIDVPGFEAHSFGSRAELLQEATGVSKYFSGGMKAELLDINVEIGPDKISALVDLTLKAKPGDERDMMVQELKITLKKIKGDWLVNRVETVKTLRL